MTLAKNEVRLSVVVAATQVPATAQQCVDALCLQQGAGGIEIVLVDGSFDQGLLGLGAPGRAEPVAIRRLPRSGADLPTLKAAGIAAARADLIAIVDPTAVPAVDWARAVIAGFKAQDAVAIGGTVHCRGTRKPANLAAYIFEYFKFEAPGPPGPTDGDLPGNNVAYRARWLREHCGKVLEREGFNKPFVHAQLRAAGGALSLVPDMQVDHVTEYHWLPFARRMYRYGRYFGAARMRNTPVLGRFKYRVAAPLVSPLLISRHLRSTVQMLPGRRELLPALLPLLGYAGAWGLGEAHGYWAGPGDAKID